MSIPIPRPSGEPVDFDIVKEEWSRFELVDDTIVRARVVLVKVYRTGQFNDKGQPLYVTGTQNVYVSIAPVKNQNDPTIPLPSPDEIQRSTKTEIEVRTRKDAWNEYKLRDGTVIRIMLVPISIQKTPFFGEDRDPIYYVTAQPLATITPPAQPLDKLDSKK